MSRVRHHFTFHVSHTGLASVALDSYDKRTSVCILELLKKASVAEHGGELHLVN
jgi:hypothetical protein